jgi:hypothetical protein
VAAVSDECENYYSNQAKRISNVSDEKPVPLWLTVATPIIVICSLGVIAYPAYQNRNATPYERDTAQYEGWMYAK